MAAFLDNCRFIPSTGGTTDWVYSSAVSGSQSPSAAGAVDGRKYKFLAISSDLTQWEIAEGAYTSASGSFARTSVLYNSAGSGSASGQSGAGTKISFTAAPNVAIVGIKEDLISIEEANSFTIAQQNQVQKNIGLPAIMRGYIDGLILSTAGSSTMFAVVPGVAADSTNADMATLAAAISKTSGAWAVGSGNGSWDGTGTNPASNAIWQHVFLIKRPDTGVVDILTSASATAPTLPTNYALFRRIGAMLANASGQWRKFLQVGDQVFWDVPAADVNNVTNSTTASLRTLTVPTGIQVLAFGSGGVAAADNNLIITSPSQTDTAPGNSTGEYRNGSTSFVQAPMWPIQTNTSGQLRFRSDGTTGSFYFNTWGWIDTRGKNS